MQFEASGSCYVRQVRMTRVPFPMGHCSAWAYSCRPDEVQIYFRAFEAALANRGLVAKMGLETCRVLTDLRNHLRK